MKAVRQIQQNGEVFLSLEDMRQLLSGMQHGKEDELFKTSVALMKVGSDLKAPAEQIIARMIGNFLLEVSGLAPEMERRFTGRN